MAAKAEDVKRAVEKEGRTSNILEGTKQDKNTEKGKPLTLSQLFNKHFSRREVIR